MKDLLHQINIYTHILFGTISMILGLWPIVSKKGNSIHKKTGRWYLRTLTIVIVTALLGGLFFNYRPFLVLLSILVFYQAFAGTRTLKLKHKRPEILDNTLVGLGIILALFYIVYFDFDKASMSRPVVLSTVIALLINLCYDLGKNLYPGTYLGSAWIYDHIVRMLSSYGGLIMAFTGNVLNPAFQPWSQLLPSVISYSLIIYFVLRQAILTKRKSP